MHHEKEGRIERLLRAWQATLCASAWGQASSVPACDAAQFSKVSRARFADDRRAVRSFKEERSRQVLTGAERLPKVAVRQLHLNCPSANTNNNVRCHRLLSVQHHTSSWLPAG
jgi:hypothetical protein